MLIDGRARLPFLRVWLTRTQHRPILGDRFRVQLVTDGLASQVVQLFGASAPNRPERSLDDASGNGIDWDADALSKQGARKALQSEASWQERWCPEDLRCDEGRVFVEDGLASLLEPVLRASGLELEDLAHENETSADESASSAGEEEAPPHRCCGLDAAIRATSAECPSVFLRCTTSNSLGIFCCSGGACNYPASGRDD